MNSCTRLGQALPRGAGAPPVAAPPPTALGRDSWRTDECKIRLHGLPEDRRPVQSVHSCLGFAVRLVFHQCIALVYWVGFAIKKTRRGDRVMVGEIIEKEGMGEKVGKHMRGGG